MKEPFFSGANVIYKGNGYFGVVWDREHFGIILDNRDDFSELKLLDAEYRANCFAIREVPLKECTAFRSWKFLVYIGERANLFNLYDDEKLFKITPPSRQAALRIQSMKKNSIIESDSNRVIFPYTDEEIVFYCADLHSEKIYKRVIGLEEYLFLTNDGEKNAYWNILTEEFQSDEQIGNIYRRDGKWIEVMPEVPGWPPRW